jgi:hypothetical protein
LAAGFVASIPKIVLVIVLVLESYASSEIVATEKPLGKRLDLLKL